ncbi:hypothetical protein OFB93_27915, partial [Escherichia coli]|nr:hypothetical protein [Escherichia coli]
MEDLLPIMKQFNTKTKDGFTVNTKVPSLKDQGKEYDGFTITITFLFIMEQIIQRAYWKSEKLWKRYIKWKTFFQL